MFDKPRRGVRAVPPHAIRPQGVGPYLLGTSLKSLLSLTGLRPRVEVFELDGIVEYSLVRAENKTIVMGVSRGTGLSFVTVLDQKIARTEKGAGVGVTVAELTEAVGELRVEPRRVRDSRILVFAALPNVRFVIEAGKVVAVSVGLEDQPPPVSDTRVVPSKKPRAPAVVPKRCSADGLRKGSAAILKFAKATPSTKLSFGCLDADHALALLSDGRRLIAVTGTQDKFRRLRIAATPGLVYAGLLDTGDDGQDEILVVTRRMTSAESAWRLEVFRSEGARFARVASREIYRVSRTGAPLLGAEFGDVDLLVELRAHDDVLRAGGLLIQRSRGRIINAAPLVIKKLAVSSRRTPVVPPPPTSRDAGVSARPKRRPASDGGGPRGRRSP